jgi:GT2 family glycosyltransferase
MESGGVSMPDVGVVIVNYNGRERTRRCVESVLAEARRGLRCIVVDNGSQDGSPGFLRDRFGADGRFGLIALDRNMGPAFARNRGIEALECPYVAFLDNDTVVTPDWLDEPLRRMGEDATIGACQCKLVLLDDPSRLDYVGDYLGPLGFLVQRAASGSRDEGQWEEEVEIFSAKSAGMVARREAVVSAGMFDEDYFIYVEETDLDWRIWLAGYRIVYCPRSVVRHEYSTSRAVLGADAHTRLVKYHGCKNYVMTLAKNMGTLRLLTNLPLHVLAWFGLAGFELCRGRWRSAGWILAGLGWNVRMVGQTLRKRRSVQRRRVLSDRDLWPRIYRWVPLSHYWRKLVTVPGTGHSEGF